MQKKTPSAWGEGRTIENGKLLEKRERTHSQVALEKGSQLWLKEKFNIYNGKASLQKRVVTGSRSGWSGKKTGRNAGVKGPCGKRKSHLPVENERPGNESRKKGKKQQTRVIGTSLKRRYCRRGGLGKVRRAEKEGGRTPQTARYGITL